eukprot:ctg_2045.g472
MRFRRSAGNDQDVGRAAQQPSQRHLHGRGAEALGDVGQGGRLQRAPSAAQRKVRHVGDAVASELVDQRVVGAIRQVVVVLHADDIADAARLGHLGGRDVAQSDMTYQALTLQVDQHAERLRERSLGRFHHIKHEAQVDHIQGVETQMLQVVVHCLRELFTRKRRQPRSVRQRLADQLVDHVRTVVIAGVDMVHARGHGLAQHRKRRVAILGRAEHPRAGQLHGTVAEPPHRAVAQRERASSINTGHWMGDSLGSRSNWAGYVHAVWMTYHRGHFRHRARGSAKERRPSGGPLWQLYGNDGRRMFPSAVRTDLWQARFPQRGCGRERG